MNRRLRTIQRSLLILIMAFGPLQAQNVFACSMMDTVVEECCCDSHQTVNERFDSDWDAAVGSNELPCCGKSVEIQVDEDAQQDRRVTSPSEIRADSDPVQALVTSFDVSDATQERAAIFVIQLQPIIHYSGSNTYLITQRLRI